jgi:hypothetical protein
MTAECRAVCPTLHWSQFDTELQRSFPGVQAIRSRTLMLEDIMKSNTHQDKKFLTRKDLAEALNVSISTVARGKRLGQWPYDSCTLVGRRVVYPAVLLDEIQALALVRK